MGILAIERRIRCAALLVAVSLAAVSWLGCATLERGGAEWVSVRTHPPGARVWVDDAEPRLSPATFELARGRDHVVVAEGAGVERSHPIRAEREWSWQIRNLFLLPGVGNLIDWISGADRRLVPTDVEIDLR